MVSGIFYVALSTICFTSAYSTSALKRQKRWGGTGDNSEMFRGTAGVDYPDFKTIPTTSFRCEDQLYEGGLYADTETQCQIYHVCHEGRKDSFICGKGTIFNQQILACDYWYSTECSTAPDFYYVNEQISNGNQPDSTNAGGHGQTRNNQNQGGNVPPNNSGQQWNQNRNQGPNNGDGTSGGQPCCCMKNVYKAPWDFPMHKSKK